MNKANKITAARIAVIPAYIVLMYLHTTWSQLVAGAIFVFAACTDFIDGYVARKHNLISDLGKFIDPLADKLLVMAALLMFVEMGRIAAWPVVIILARELTITLFRTLAALNSRVIAADVFGKIKTIVQMVALSCMHFEGIFIFLVIFDTALFYLSVALTIFSGVNYLYKNKKIIESR